VVLLRFFTDFSLQMVHIESPAWLQKLMNPKVPDYDEDRALTTDSGWKTPSSTGSIRTVLAKFKWVLLIWVRPSMLLLAAPDQLLTKALFGTALMFADGMLTPAVSVTSAVGGIALTVPSLDNNINSISIGFLVALFLIQRFGTAKISHIFSPG
jgi:KUP system potassium uptake protein